MHKSFEGGLRCKSGGKEIRDEAFVVQWSLGPLGVASDLRGLNTHCKHHQISLHARKDSRN